MKKRYISNVAYAKIPAWLRRMVWYMWEVMEVPKRSSLQTFTLSRSEKGQRITHSQEQPPYCQTIETEVTPAEGAIVCGTVFLIEESDCVNE